MYHAPWLTLFLSSWDRAVILGQLLKVFSVSASKGSVTTFISTDYTRYLFYYPKNPISKQHPVFQSYQMKVRKEIKPLWSLDVDDNHGMIDDSGISGSSKTVSRQQHPRSTRKKELSPYFKQDRREWDDRGSPIFPPITDPVGLANLLEQRHLASLSDLDRSSRQRSEMYHQVARIDQQLKDNYNVFVYNHPPIWSRFDSNAPPNAIRKQQIQKELLTLQRAFGPTGHQYRHVVGPRDNNCSALDCDLSVTDIHILLSQYTKCKCTFQSELADATLFELSLHGVRISDRTLQWTTDAFCDIDCVPELTNVLEKNDDASAIGFRNRIRHMQNCTSKERQSYIQDHMVEVYIDDGGVDVKCGTKGQRPNRINSNGSKNQRRIQQVEQLIRERYMALKREEHDLVAWFTYELYCTYNVTVNDTTKRWSFGDTLDKTMDRTLNGSIPQPPTVFPNPKSMLFPSLLFGHEGHFYDSTIRYRESRCSRFPSDLHRNRIESLVQERIQKREEGKFLEADTIRNILWHTYVSLCDP
jgi:hypothetical protein